MMSRLLLAFALLLLPPLGHAQSRDLPDFADLAERQGAAVVNISTTQVVRGHGRGGQVLPFDEDDPA